MRSIKFLLVLIFTTFLIVNVNASFELGNISNSIQKIYIQEENVKGWLNVSFSNEPIDSLLESNRQESISLIDLLSLNDNFDYACNPITCGTSYSASNGETEKTMDLNKGQSKIIGFKFSGMVQTINSIKFTVESNAPKSCQNQLKIDILNDEVAEFGNDVSSSESCSSSKSYGCFDANKETEVYGSVINQIPYCQRIHLGEAPGFQIGALVKHISGSKKLTMELKDKFGTLKGECVLPSDSITDYGGEVSCEVDYLVTEPDDYYVCIYSDDSQGEYQTRGYSDAVAGCGYFGDSLQSETLSFGIFANGRKFGPLETLNVENSLPNDDTFSAMSLDYISENYGDTKDCANGCIVPIKLISNEDQTIMLKDLEISYNNPILKSENRFYDIAQTSAKINADFQKLFLDDANFSVSENLGNYTFALNLSDQDFFSKEVFIENRASIQKLSPLITIAGFPTDFKIEGDFSNFDITKYQWDFGDGKIKTTSVNKITYTYKNTGRFNFTANITDSKGRVSSKGFKITVGTPILMVNETLKNRKKSLEKISDKINTFPKFYQDSLKSALSFDDFETELKDLQKQYQAATDDQDYIKILEKLWQLEIPSSIIVTKSGDSITFYPKKENINLDLLETIGETNYDSEKKDKYLNSVLTWNQENLETKISLKEFSAVSEDGIEELLNVFELKINKKEGADDLFYLIIDELENLKFQKDYSEKKESGYTYLTLENQAQTIIFSTTEKIDFIDLPMFISPEISKLTILKDTYEEAGKAFKIKLFIGISLSLIILGFIVYILLQIWYKKKYEKYLFKNPNNMYNLVSYIQNSKKQGLSEKDIRSKLKKAGWTGEQVNYVIKKYSGKRTGMIELPIDKIFNIFKRNKNEDVKSQI